jgi:hypothetical protein
MTYPINDRPLAWFRLAPPDDLPDDLPADLPPNVTRLPLAKTC